MNLLWADAFELGTQAAIRDRYESSATCSGVSSIRTNQCLSMGGGNIEKRFSQGYQKVCVGIAIFCGDWTFGGGNTEFIKLFDSAGNRQLTLFIDTSGVFKLYRGTSSGTLLASSGAVTAGFTVYVELLVTISATVGTYELRINEVSQFSGSNANTRNGAYDDVQRVQINSQTNTAGQATYFVDDFVIYDATTPFPNSTNYFPGNIKIECLVPSGPGTITGWTKFNDSNYKNVDEMPHNSDTDYNYSSTVNASDLYAMGNMSTSTGSVRGLQLTYYARKDDALVRATRPLISAGGVTYAGSNDSLTTSYAAYYEVWQQNPNTGSDWAISEINAVQAGIQTTS